MPLKKLFCSSFELRPSLFEIPSFKNNFHPGGSQILPAGNFEETSPIFDENGIPGGFNGTSVLLEEVRKIAIVIEDGNRGNNANKKFTVYSPALRERKKFADSKNELSRTRDGGIDCKRNCLLFRDGMCKYIWIPISNSFARCFLLNRMKIIERIVETKIKFRYKAYIVATELYNKAHFEV